MSHKPPQEDPDSGWCESCNEPCEGTWQDEGIGAFEYWGSKGYDCQWVAVSSCCGSGILDTDPDPDPDE